MTPRELAQFIADYGTDDMDNPNAFTEAPVRLQLPFVFRDSCR